MGQEIARGGSKKGVEGQHNHGLKNQMEMQGLKDELESKGCEGRAGGQ